MKEPVTFQLEVIRLSYIRIGIVLQQPNVVLKEDCQKGDNWLYHDVIPRLEVLPSREKYY